MRQSTAPPRDEQWRVVYDRLRTSLSEIGKNDALGGGDYWLVDDDWGRTHQKICVANPTFWTPAVEAKVREILASFPDWGVYVVFEMKPPRQGFIVYADGISSEPRGT